MPRLTPPSSKECKRFFEKHGWEKDRQDGSHIVMQKAGTLRPIVIPDGRKHVSWRSFSANLRTAQLTRRDYKEYLDNQ